LEVSDHPEKFVEDSVGDPLGRERLANFVFDFLKNSQPYEKARHPQVTPLRLVGNSDFTTRYTDGEKGPVSLVLRESLEELEDKYGHSVDVRRFRINLILEGAPAWSELSWIGKKLQVGNCVLQITKPIGRCPNIDVDPETGERKDEIFPEMKKVFGHSLFGIKAEVETAGNIRLDDSWVLKEG
jgi:uncharacterized protein YcbX